MQYVIGEIGETKVIATESIFYIVTFQIMDSKSSQEFSDSNNIEQDHMNFPIKDEFWQCAELSWYLILQFCTNS